jgi:hypothetical protein
MSGTAYLKVMAAMGPMKGAELFACAQRDDYATIQTAIDAGLPNINQAWDLAPGSVKLGADGEFQQSASLLQVAAAAGADKTAEYLLGLKEIDPNVSHDVKGGDLGGMTPLMLACRVGAVGVVDLLLQHTKIRVNKIVDCDGDYHTALHVACHFKQLGALERLLGHPGLDRDENFGFDGETALHVCDEIGFDAGAAAFSLISPLPAANTTTATTMPDETMKDQDGDHHVSSLKEVKTKSTQDRREDFCTKCVVS